MVTLWWGLFDHELFVEHEDQRFGPFGPIDGPIPLHHYRSFRKSTVDERIDRIEMLASTLGLPRAALEGPVPIPARPVAIPATVPFNDPDPFQELRFPSILAAKLAIADYLGRPLAKLAADDLGYIEALLKETLERRTIITCVRGYFRDRAQRGQQEDGEHAR
jgi:hypothetical protein